MSESRVHAVKSRPGALIRFIISGVVNTGVTFGIYLALLSVVPYSLAYSVAFVCGIVISYTLNRFFVFRAGGGLGTVVLFPLVYLVQYTLGLLVVFIWVDVLDLAAGAASVVAVVATVPVTYVLSRHLFLRRAHGQQGRRDTSRGARSERTDSTPTTETR